MTVSTHVLDASRGIPAVGVPVALARAALPASAASPADSRHWVPLESGVTDADGRHRFTVATPPGTYQLTFATGPYFAARGTGTFYPEVTITFTVPEPPDAAANGKAAHFHVPLLLSPFAYSTYRGS